MLAWIPKALFKFSVLTTMILAEPRSLNDDLLSMNSDSLNTLSELPLDKLLKLRYSISDSTEPTESSILREHDSIPASNRSPEKAEALALRSDDPIKRTGYGSVLKKKPSKVNTVFMLSVTTLSFLAFGGYLLCLIVQAIKNKSGDGTASTVNNGASILISSAIKKKKKPRDDRKKRDILDPPVENVGNLYEALIALCEGYAKWEKNAN